MDKTKNNCLVWYAFFNGLDLNLMVVFLLIFLIIPPLSRNVLCIFGLEKQFLEKFHYPFPRTVR
jgi:hypothetical protein